MFLSDVEARRDRMLGLVVTMMTADVLRLTAYRPLADEMCIIEGS